MQICSFNSEQEIKKTLQEIGVDPYGIKIMLPKAQFFTIHLKSISFIWANILKQEMLALGGDLAQARGVLTGRVKKTDCLIFGTLAQFKALTQKLKIQPFGLKNFGADLANNLKNYLVNDFKLQAGKYNLNLSARPQIMGIINLTPDSFSGDGLYATKALNYPELALEKAHKLYSEGADIIDLGGESSRPGAKSIDLKEELKRTIPIIKLLAKKIKLPISIDTNKAAVAKAALDSGAVIVNDISGLKDIRMAKTIAAAKAAVIIMHLRGIPENMQKNIAYNYLFGDIQNYLKKQIEFAQSSGIKPENIIIDPGICFAKDLADNLKIIKNLDSFKILGKPILIGTSRKSFIGKIIGDTFEERLSGTLATSLLAFERGAKILRVHDVRQVRQVLKMTQAVLNAN